MKSYQTAATYRDLDHHFGNRSEKEFNPIKNAMESERRSDQELWPGEDETDLPPIETSPEFIKLLRIPRE